MIYHVEAIKRDVRACIDQDRTSDALVTEGDMDVLMLDKVVESKIAEAVERVHSEAPYYMLESVAHNFEGASATIYWQGSDDTCGWVLLPQDFLRLVVFEMSDWEKAVYLPISTDNPKYARQRGRVKGLRGNAQRPVCVVAVRPEGRVLEFYSCKSRQATMVKRMYVSKPEIVDDENHIAGIDISEQCYTAVVYTAAALTLVSCGEADKAKTMFEIAKTYLTR